jgi:hypothetical protein
MIGKFNVLSILGIVLILAGTVFNLLEAPRYVTVFMYITGGSFKSIDVYNGFKSGKLAGWNYLALLFLGLLLLFISIMVRKETTYSSIANAILFTAISIKIISIIGMRRTALVQKKHLTDDAVPLDATLDRENNM